MRDDEAQQDHLWRRLVQHERAKRRCLKLAEFFVKTQKHT